MYKILASLDAVEKKTLTEGQDMSDVPAALRKERGYPELTLQDLKKSKGNLSDRRTLEKMPGGQQGRYRPELDEQDGKEIDYSTLEIDGIDYRDAPEFSDAYFSNGYYTDGTQISDEDLERLTADGDLLYQMLSDKLYEADMEEGNEFSGALAKAKAAGAKEFEVDGKEYAVKEGYADFFDKKMAYQKIGATVDGQAQDYTVTFKDGTRKRYVEKNGRRQVFTLEPVDRQPETDDEGNVVKRGRGRPKGATRSLGAKGPSGRSKLMREMDDVHPADHGEYDREGDMALNQLHQIADAVEELHSILDAEENLPEWVQSKITKAVDYLDTARDYLAAKDEQYAAHGEEPIAEKWDTETKVAASEKGKYAGKTKTELLKQYNALKQSGPHKKGSEEYGKMRELAFAIRAKTGWGKVDEQQVDEKAVSKAQQQAAGAALAAKRGEAPASELKGASKEMMKMSTKDLEDFAKTKHTGLPKKKDESVEEEAKPDYIDLDKDGDRKESMKKAAADKKEQGADKDEVEETTASGSVATGAEANAASKGIYGKGVYEGYDQQFAAILNESMSVNVSSSTDGGDTVTVTATEEDAQALSQLLQMAGLFQSSGYEQVETDDAPCSECGGVGGLHEAECSHRVNEEYANEPDAVYGDMDLLLNKLSGGLNGPKKQVNPNNPGDNPLAMKSLGKSSSPAVNLEQVAEDIEAQEKQRLWDLYKRYE